MININDYDSFKTNIEPVTKEQYLKFIELEKKAVEFIKNLPNNITVRLISHLDADGITSAAIMINALKNENIKYELTIFPQLTEDVCQTLSKETFEYYIITDLGSSQLNVIKPFLSEKKLLILDHHTLQEDAPQNIVHVNPHLTNIDGSSLISGSGTVFFFACLLNKKNYDSAHLALIGAIGDVQENSGFVGLNNLILDVAIERNKIKLKKELNLFGKQTRPLYKLLEYSSDLEIPGITGNQKATIFFLEEIGIKPITESGKVKTFVDLTDKEKKILTEHIIIKRLNAGLTNQENIFSNTYEIIDSDLGSFKDAKEFSTILNACGRMDQAKTGVYACLDEIGFKEEAKQVQKDYKIEIVHGMNWIEKQLKDSSDLIISNDKYMIINAKNNIMHTIIGTVASILTMSKKYPENFYVLSLAHNTCENTIKVSMRIVGNPEDIDLQDIINKIVEKLGVGESGGHQHAAGAVIPLDSETKFLEIAKQELDNL